MKTYTLNIVRNGQKETVVLQQGQAVNVQAQPDTAYQLLDAEGRLVAQPDVEWVGDDLWVYTGPGRGAQPDLVLNDYRTSFPVQNSQYTAQSGHTFVTAADEAALAQTVPLAEEVTVARNLGGAKLWGAATIASGLAAVGLTAARRDGGEKQAAATPQGRTGVAEKPGEPAVQLDQKPAEPAVQPDQKPSEPVPQPDQKPGEPVVQPEKPSEPAQPDNKPSEPVSQPDQKPGEPVIQPERPSEPAKPDEKPLPPVITINGLTDDNIINAAEMQRTVTVSGRVENARDGDVVKLTIGGREYAATVQAGTFHAAVDGAVLAEASEIRAAVQTASGALLAAVAVKNYTVDTEIAAPVIRFNAVAQDDIINLAESQAVAVTVSGTVEHAADNDEIVLTVGEAAYRGVVSGGKFAVEVDTKTLLNHGKITAALTTTDNAGNTAAATAERAYRVDTEHSPVISLDNIAGDNVLNIAESQGNVRVSGRVTDVADGKDVLVSCGCESCGSVKWIEILAKVKDGGFSVDFSGADLKGSSYNIIKASVTSSDDAGNTATAETARTYTKDLAAPSVSVSVNAVAGNDVLEKAERVQAGHEVSGTVSGVQEGERVRSVAVEVNGQTYQATVSGNTFSAAVPTERLAAASSVTARAVVEDAAGNTAVAENTRSYVVAPTAPVLVLDPVASDGFINKAEADSNKITLSGRVENVPEGTVVSLQTGSQTVSATVSDGRFSVEVGKSFFGIGNNTKTAEGTLSASLGFSDGGVRAEASDTKPFRIDLANQTEITIDAITGDNVVDGEEIARPTITVSGKVTDGKTDAPVTVNVNKIEQTVLLRADGTYSAEFETARVFPKGSEGRYAVTANVKRVDEAGNEGSGNAGFARIFMVDKTPPVGTIVFDAITGDNVLNRSETAQSTVTVSGVVTRLTDGDDVQSVTVLAGGNEYAARLKGTSFSVEIPTAVMTANTEVSARGIVKDAAGRTAEAAGATQSYTLQTAAPSIEIRIDSINGGQAVNAAARPGKIVVAGSLVAGETIAAGSETVGVTINGKTYTPELSGQNWTLELPATVFASAEGRLNVGAFVRAADSYGNTAEHTAVKSYEVDTVAPAAVITLDNIATDNIIDGSEKTGNITVSGKVSGEFKQGDRVILTAGGKEHEAVVDGSGVFSADISAVLLNTAAVPVVYAALRTTDAAGNVGTAHASRSYEVKNGNIGITLNTITGDDAVNVTEAAGQIVVSGSISGADAKAGQTVSLTVGGETLTAQVQNDLSFSTTVAAEKLLANGGYTVHAAVSGENGATAKTARSYEVSAEAAAKIDITRIGSGFDVDLGQTVATTRIGGVIEVEGAFAEGMNSGRLRQITVTAGGKTYTAGVKADRSFFLDIPTKELAALNGETLGFKINTDPQLYDLVQTGANAYRVNKLARNAEVQVKTITFDSPYVQKGSDGLYRIADAAEGKVSVSGTVGGSAKAGDTVMLEVGGKMYKAAVHENLTFAAHVAAEDFAADSGRDIRAVLHTADLSGKDIAVADTESYAVQNRNSGEFVSSHSRINGSTANSDHTAAGYNFPYFIQKTGNINGGSYGITFGGKADGPAVIKYHFLSLDEVAALPANYNHYIDRSTMSSYSAELQAMVRNVYQEISSVTNIEFVEVGSMAEANTNYVMGNLRNGFEGSSAIAYNGGLVAWNSRHNYMSWGKDFVNYIVRHEITHTLGMGHTSNGFTGDYLKEENIEFSNMSYNAYTNNGLFLNKNELRPYDLAYLHYAFGVSKSARTGNDTYTFKNYNMYSKDADRYIWDAAGVDTFDASAEKQGVNVNLTPGSWIYSGSGLEKTFAVKSNATHDMRSYFGLDAGASVAGNGANDKVTLNTYTEGQAFIGYGTQIENLIGSAHDDVLTGNNADNNIYGGAGNDTLAGGAGNDYLDGGAGADTLAGGAGNDTYVVDDAGDTVTEAAGSGEDHVYSSVNHTLADNLEHLTLIGTTAVSGTGNSQNNTLTGNGLDNTLIGAAGDDRIIGGAGSDTLMGGEGRDTFVFNHTLDGSVDTVTDFTVGQDTIELDKSIFGSLVGNTMAEWQQYVRYHADTGSLTYDSDGSGRGDGIHFATLDKNLAIDHTSFTVV